MVRGAVKGEPRELLGVEAVGALLRRVAADRQGAGQRLGLEAVAEAGQITAVRFEDSTDARVCAFPRGLNVHGQPP